MNKKVISSVLAGAMAISTMSVAASATESTNTFSAKAGLKEFTINADIPAELETFINPYGAQVKGTTGTGVVTAVGYSDGIISPVYSIKNKDTNTGLKVSATAKITGSSTVTLMTKPMLEDKLEKATEKQVFAFLNTTKNANTTTPIFSSTKYVGNEEQIVFTEDGTKAAGIMSLTNSSGDNATGYFYVGGQCTPNPETAWDSKDTVAIDLILDLVPSAGEAADLSLASIKLGAADIEKEFDGTKTSYELVASGSKTKAATIVVTAKNDKSIVYVKFNGKFQDASSGAITAAKDQIGVTKYTDGTSAGTVTVAAATDGSAAVDYNVGDKLEFIVVDATSNESATYTINFT